MNNVVGFPTQRNERFEGFGTEYAHSKLPEILDFYDRCGLEPTFLAMLGRHIADLELIIVDPGSTPSTLSVAARIDDTGEKQWYRAALLSRAELTDKKDVLEEVVGQMEFEVEDPGSLNYAALSWGFYELAADAVGNTVSMQQHFNKYIPDWNGQAYCHRAQSTVSEELFRRYSQATTPEAVDEEIRNNSASIAFDHSGLRSGVALELLRDALLHEGVVDRVARSNWIIKAVQRAYYQKTGVEPLPKHLITARISMLSPRQHQRDIEFYFDRYFEEDGLE